MKKIPTPEERAKALLRIEKQTSREVAKCFSNLVDRVTAKVGAFPPGVLPLFAEGLVDVRSNPAFARMLDTELTRFSRELEEANERGVTRAWTLSDHYGDIDTRGYLHRTGATALLSRYTIGTKEAQTAHRAEAVRAFLDRRDRKGFTISGRVWRTAEQAMQHIETSLSEGLAEGRSAAELSRTIRQDLREPDKLFRRVRDKNGNLQLSKPAQAYHPGQGVYRSSYKNALRLTRTEINVSYAEADFERWQRLDFVIGYEVRLSNNHTCNGHPFTDICDELAGKYPKWFKFTKWHPQCRCVCLAIFDDDPGAGEVRDVPANFKQWVTDNQPRLDRSIKKGTAPYWVRDNFSKEGKLTGAGRKPATAGSGRKPPKPPITTTTAPADPDEERRRSRETLSDLAERLGKDLPPTLKNLQKLIQRDLSSVRYSSSWTKPEIAKTERIIKEVIDNGCYGMNVPRCDSKGNSDVIDKIFSSWFKNQIETGTGKGLVDVTFRKKASRALFGTSPKAQAVDYERYGFLMDKDIIAQAHSRMADQYWSYGDGIQIRFRKDKTIATFTMQDSLGSGLHPSLCSDPKITSFGPYWNKSAIEKAIDTTSTIKATKGLARGYIELQYHGMLTPECVESVFIPKDVLQKLNAGTLKLIKKSGATVYSEDVHGKLITL